MPQSCYITSVNTEETILRQPLFHALHCLVNYLVAVTCKNADIFFQRFYIENIVDTDPNEFAIAFYKKIVVGIVRMSGLSRKLTRQKQVGFIDRLQKTLKGKWFQ